MSDDTEIKKKLKDVNTYSIDELKELLGLSIESNEYTLDDIEKHFWLLSNKYQRLARNGFLGKAKKRIVDNLNINPDVTPRTNADPEDMNKWWTNQYLPSNDPSEMLRNTNRKDRIQTFDDSYEFIGSLNSQYKQIGNAVPVELAKHMGEALLKIL